MLLSPVPLAAAFAEEWGKFLHSPVGWGQNGAQINAGQTFVRAVVVYSFAVALVRLGNRRSLSRASVFDAIISVTLGSTLSRAITGGAYLLPSLSACAALVGLHWLLAALTFRLDWLSGLVKGRDTVMVRDGVIDQAAMRREHFGEGDLFEALRQQGKLEDVHKVKAARVERSGEVSVLKREEPPKVLEVRVENGVQTVRIEVSSGG